MSDEQRRCKMYVVFAEPMGYFAVNAENSTVATELVEKYLKIPVESSMVFAAPVHALYAIDDINKE